MVALEEIRREKPTMKTRTALVATMTLLASTAGLSACATRPPPNSDAIVATLGEDGGDIVLRRGQTLHANLYLQEGTGMVWRIEQADLLAKVGYQGRMVGRGGRPLPGVVRHNEVVQQFTFQASRRGEGALVFTLAGRDPAVQPEQVAIYRVHVR